MIDGVDLPRIIRESTTSVTADVMTADVMTADVMTDVRTQGERPTTWSPVSSTGRSVERCAANRDPS